MLFKVTNYLILMYLMRSLTLINSIPEFYFGTMNHVGKETFDMWCHHRPLHKETTLYFLYAFMVKRRRRMQSLAGQQTAFTLFVCVAHFKCHVWSCAALCIVQFELRTFFLPQVRDRTLRSKHVASFMEVLKTCEMTAQI